MLLFLLETALKKYCYLHPELAEKLCQKSILITLLPLKKSWKISFINQSDITCYVLRTQEAELHSVDLKISATPQALMAMFLRGDKIGLKLEGDVILAQVLEHSFNEVMDKKSIEKIFQEYLGEFSFYPVKTFMKKSHDCLKNFTIQTKNTVADYLQEEHDCLPLPLEVNVFCDEVDELRLRVDRLEARYEKNEKN